VAVVDTATNQFLGYVTGSGGHSIAVDPNNNNIYVPVTRSRYKGIFSPHASKKRAYAVVFGRGPC